MIVYNSRMSCVPWLGIVLLIRVDEADGQALLVCGLKYTLADFLGTLIVRDILTYITYISVWWWCVWRFLLILKNFLSFNSEFFHGQIYIEPPFQLDYLAIYRISNLKRDIYTL